ncbi:hypothetical protein [Nostoc sp.]
MPTRDWASIRKTLIAVYNPTVQEKFATNISTNKEEQMNQLMIQSNDSSLIAQSRITLFNLRFPSALEVYSAVPEWWQVRIEAGRPQMIFMFAEVLGERNFGSAKYPISIPHPIVKHYQNSPLPDYQKGQYEGILILNDNSKVIINAISEEEANRVLTACKAIIIPDFLTNAIQKVSQRRGVELLTINVHAKRVDYFSTGLKKTKPDWTDTFP